MSPELHKKLTHYAALLEKWQRAINLVSHKSLSAMQQRHFDDSLQLLTHIPSHVRILWDLGSGGGFPGMVIAMARPDLAVTLVESDQRKCTFLNTVSRETDTPVTIRNQRIEALEDVDLPDLVTARALAPLAGLLGFCAPWAAQKPALEMLFLKGGRVDAEIAEAQRLFSFSCDTVPSRTDDTARIVHIKNLKNLSIKQPS